jgi:hypothetical protein
MNKRLRLTIGIVVFCALCVGTVGMGLRKTNKAIMGDFSAFWVSAWWFHERPTDVPLYYPMETKNNRNLSIWEKAPQRGNSAPWASFGRKHDYPSTEHPRPKFYLYPPLFAMLFTPLIFVKSLPHAAAVWQCINAVAFILGVLLLACVTCPRSISRINWTSVILACSLIFYPLVWSFELGQNSLFLFLVWTLLLWSLAGRRETIAGTALAFLIFVKLGPVLLIPWLAWRRFFKTLAIALLALFVFLGISMWGVGWGEMKTYFTGIVPLLSTGTPYFQNQSLLGHLIRMDSGVSPLSAAADASISASAFAGYVFTSLAIIGVQALGVFVQRNDRQEQIVHEFSGWILVLLMVVPIVWSHHLVLAIIPLAYTTSRIINRLNAPDGLTKWSQWILPLAVLIVSGVLQGAASPSQHTVETIDYTALLSYRLLGVLLLWILLQFFHLLEGQVKHTVPIQVPDKSIDC